MAEKTRLILTILAVAWGTASISGMLAVGEGLRLTFSRAMSGVGNGVIYVRGGQTSTLYNGRGLNQHVLLTPQAFTLLKKGVADIKTMSPQYSFSAKFSYHNKSASPMAQAVNPSFGQMRNIIAAKGGRFIDPLDMRFSRRVVVLGNQIATTLFSAGENPLGKTIKIANQPFLVIGVMRQKLQMAGPPDSYGAWIPASTFVTLTNPKKIDQFVLIPKQLDQNGLIKNQIRTLIAYQQHLDPNDQNLIKYRDYQIAQQRSNELFTGMEIFLGLVGMLTLIVAGVGIANVMFISVNRATREIGIRMAVGARSYQVLIHYVIEALLATAIGGFIGIAVTKIIIFGISLIPMHGQFFKMIGKPIPVLSPSIVIVVILILGFIGLVAGIFPATKAAKIDPAIALRHE